MLASMAAFLQERRKLRINANKSACARPWQRKFLGYSLRAHRQARLRIAPESLQRLRARVKELTCTGKGKSLAHMIDLAHRIEDLTPVLRGWMNYFQLTQSMGPLEELDGWIRRRRCLLWRQAKHRAGRTWLLRRQGVEEGRAWHSARNGRGPW